MGYTVELHREARKALESLPKDDRERVAAAIEGLATDPTPTGSKPLKGKHAGLRRLRVGVYRIVYSIDGDALKVLVLRVGHRKGVYR